MQINKGKKRGGGDRSRSSEENVTAGETKNSKGVQLHVPSNLQTTQAPCDPTTPFSQHFTGVLKTHGLWCTSAQHTTLASPEIGVQSIGTWAFVVVFEIPVVYTLSSPHAV